MNHAGAEHQRGIGQRMLAQQGRLMHIHAQPEHEGDAHAHTQRLVHAPEGEQQQHHVGQPHHATQRQQVDGQRHHQADDDERRVDRLQQLLAARHHHADRSFMAFICARPCAWVPALARARGARAVAPPEAAAAARGAHHAPVPRGRNRCG
ncbi:hypothetical protein SDC9_201816 [bioreactor metagenome]|uniref:Uncharacterized protein n=1 Tax=bioreactor metagenome TaxID=1076179 RepID=A0A645ISE4_9ZZZZ